MSDRLFFDTNILVYAFDKSDTEKHNISARLIKTAFENRNGHISTQVLQEFFVVTTQKIEKTLTINEARDIINDFPVWTVVDTNLQVILQAIEVMKEYHLSFRDSLIVCTAKVAGCNIIYTEDLSHQQIIGNTRIINPYRPLPPPVSRQ
ncbi:MAG: PIN domain-containing protein [Nitrospirae bacterium]|nr:PIN domain-containing protein [Nitrospirota bacterium]